MLNLNRRNSKNAHKTLSHTLINKLQANYQLVTSNTDLALNIHASLGVLLFSRKDSFIGLKDSMIFHGQ